MSAAESDFVIVGAGAAGSVMASRLSEDPRTSVVLVEAGDDVVAGHEPEDIRNVFPLSSFNRSYTWPDTRVHWNDATGPAVPLPQGRIVGGSSALMGMWAMRGRPDDYDDWRAAGAAGWGWTDVLPYFRKLESDIDFAGPLHGSEGPIPIRRESRAAWPPFASAVANALAERGFREIDDMNADFDDGHCVLPVSRYENSRASAGLCYLDAKVRARPNLRVLTRLTATRLLAEGRRIRGVELRTDDGSTQPLHARETLVAAGALRSPALLLRSGIGDGAALQRAGIATLAHLRGVGRNLQNHPVLYLASMLKRAGRQGPGWRPAGSTYLRYSSGVAGVAQGDMALYIRSYLTWHALGRRMSSLAPLLTKPCARGTVALDPAAPDGPPTIEFRFASDARDVSRLAEGLRFAISLYASDELSRVCGDAYLVLDASRLAQFNEVSVLNAARGSIASALMDLSPFIEKRLLSGSSHMRRSDALPEPADELLAIVRENVTGTGHVCGTCRIGAADDAEAVVDVDGRVHGVAGVRVIDASVMPSVPRGNTHIPTVMVAEKLASAIRSANSLS